jgi:hypothetical protein
MWGLKSNSSFRSIGPWGIGKGRGRVVCPRGRESLREGRCSGVKIRSSGSRLSVSPEGKSVRSVAKLRCSLRCAHVIPDKFRNLEDISRFPARLDGDRWVIVVSICARGIIIACSIYNWITARYRSNRSFSQDIYWVNQFKSRPDKNSKLSIAKLGLPHRPGGISEFCTANLRLSLNLRSASSQSLRMWR